MNERDRMVMNGEVIDIRNDKFKVRVNPNYEVLCTLSGKIRLSGIRILVSDKVSIEISEYDPTKGRITFRHKVGS